MDIVLRVSRGYLDNSQFLSKGNFTIVMLQRTLRCILMASTAQNSSEMIMNENTSGFTSKY